MQRKRVEFFFKDCNASWRSKIQVLLFFSLTATSFIVIELFQCCERRLFGYYYVTCQCNIVSKVLSPPLYVFTCSVPLEAEGAGRRPPLVRGALAPVEGSLDLLLAGGAAFWGPPD